MTFEGSFYPDEIRPRPDAALGMTCQAFLIHPLNQVIQESNHPIQWMNRVIEGLN